MCIRDRINTRACICPSIQASWYVSYKFMRVRVLYHDHCFDGAASAAYFTRFMQGVFYPEAEYVYTGMAHKLSLIHI